MSFYEIMNKLANSKQKIDVEYIINNIEKKDTSFLESANNLLDKYSKFASTIGFDYKKNIWYGLINYENTYANKLEFKKHLLEVEKFTNSLISLVNKVSEKYNINISNLSDAYEFSEFANFLGNSKFVTPAIFNNNTYKYIYDNLNNLQSNAYSVLNNKKYLDVLFKTEFYQLNYNDYLYLLKVKYKSGIKRLFSSEYKNIKQEIEYLYKKNKKIKYICLIDNLNKLSNYSKSLEKFDSINNIIKEQLNNEYKELNTDWSMFIKELTEFNHFLSIGNFGIIDSFSLSEFNNEKITLCNLNKEIRQAYEKIKHNILFYKDFFDDKIVNFSVMKLHDLLNHTSQYIDKFDEIDNWCNFIKLYNQLTDNDLVEYIDYTISNSIESEKLSKLFTQIYYTQWAYLIISKTPILSELDRLEHDRIVNDFAEEDKTHFEINKLKIREKLSSDRPNLNMVTAGSAINILLHEAQKKKKQKPIRNLLLEARELVQKLKPCFLMSPLSVSTFLSPDFTFDVIIFDEASQIFPQDALGAIYRGNQIIVVGDKMQMPPSNFFNSLVNVNSDDDAEDISDFESILDLCSTTYNQLSLKWHYRSKYEQLIAFSNKNYYRNNLITFSSSKVDTKGIGVDYYYVDGVFDHTSKNNIKEAEFVVDLIYDNLERYPERSLGVVAFSVSQQSLIENLLARKRQKDPRFEHLLGSDTKEPFFIKNLETVQGDERDTIIFSVGYGKDSQGRVLHNFGPINNAGGERRLNVAVTRAKCNVQLVSSMHHYDIDLSKTKARGAQLLKEYLDYAENGALVLDKNITVNQFEQFDSDFELEVCEFLRENGYVVDTQVGCSSFKIDLGLKKPNSSDYVLAIECDGASYHSSKNARDRDRLRQEILENMGWKFYRIWSTDWFKNNKVEKQKLLDVVEKAVNYTDVKKKLISQ